MAVALAVLAPAAQSQTPPSGGQIYSCVDASGKKLTSDRPIPECATREQFILNRDGSVKGRVPPTPTADERAEMERRDQEAATDRAARQEAIRRDRNLLARFPNEAAHRKAREAALDDVRKSIRRSESRLEALATERKPLLAEAEFYKGKRLPAALKTQLDGNEATAEAQSSLLHLERQEVQRIDKRYDLELERLRKLWSGAQPGSGASEASR